MSKSEDKYTLKQLSSNNTEVDITAMLYISICLNPKHPLTKVIVSAKGEEWLRKRLEFKYTHWVPQILKKLETGEYACAIENYVDTILSARHSFPSTIEPLVNLTHLAKIRRNAHVRKGSDAVEYIRTEKGYNRRNGLEDLARALLAEVPKELIGDPTESECAEAFDEVFYTTACKESSDATTVKALEHSAELLRERTDELNNVLNHLL